MENKLPYKFNLEKFRETMEFPTIQAAYESFSWVQHVVSVDPIIYFSPEEEVSDLVGYRYNSLARLAANFKFYKIWCDPIEEK